MCDVRTTRRTLIQRLKNTANDDAWREFYDFYREIITGWACRFGCSPAKADDVFQETMVCLLRQMSTFEYNPDRGSFRSYLKTIVKSRCYDLFRKESRYITLDKEDSLLDAMNSKTIETTDIEDDNIWLNSLVQQALRQVFKKIDQTTYKSFCMYVLEARPVTEVSEKLDGLRTGTIYQQKSRVLKMLEKEFLLLLNEMDEPPVKLPGRGLFIKALEEMLNQRPDYRETMLTSNASCPEIELFEIIKQALAELPPPDKKGAYLCVIENGSARDWHELTQSTTIGNKPGCSLLINDQRVSGLHLEISRENQSFHARDCNSANGTYLNNRIMTEAVELSDGDILRLTQDSLLIFNQLG